MEFLKAAMLVMACAQAPIARAQQVALPPINLDMTLRADVGGVARLMAAQDLYALARAQYDPLAALTAARIMSEIALSPVQRRSVATVPPPMSLPLAKAMFELAKVLALDDGVTDLIDVERALSGTATDPVVVQISMGQAVTGMTDHWELAFYAGSLAEIAIVGTGDGVLNIQITDSGGHLVCQQAGPRDRLYCPFVPRENGRFSVAVTNPGPSAATYALLTN